MGTCFTKTRHVSGRQPKSEHPTRQQRSQHPSRQHRSGPPSSTKQYNNTTKNVDHMHGANGLQSSHNRRVCGQQKTCGSNAETNRTFQIDKDIPRTFPSSRYALLASTSYEVQAKLSVSCNDGSGGDHLRQREHIYFYDDSHMSQSTPSDEDQPSASGVTCPAMAVSKRGSNLCSTMVESKPFSDSSRIPKNTEDTASLSGYNGNNGSSVLLCDASKVPPPTFTKNQKRLVILAWHHIHVFIEEVGMHQFIQLFRYDRDTLGAFPFLHRLMSDAELFSEDYCVGPMTISRIYSHTEAMFKVFDQIVKELQSNDEGADKFISELLYPLGVSHFGYGCYVQNLELHGLVMVRALVRICCGQQNQEIKSKETEEALFIFFKVINYWIMQGMRYVQGKGMD